MMDHLVSKEVCYVTIDRKSKVINLEGYNEFDTNIDLHVISDKHTGRVVEIYATKEGETKPIKTYRFVQRYV